MASLFSSRRKPKKISTSEPRDETTEPRNDVDSEDGPVVRRPTTAPKQKSKLRISFDPAASTEDSEDNATTSRTVPGSRLRASALARSARLDRDQEVERPTYSKSYLDELKGSTPTTPKDLSQYNSSNEDDLALIQPQTQALDIASKFGPSAIARASSIPSAAEIAEKKERRNRLAKEQNAAALTTAAPKSGSVRNQDDFISLDAYDSDGEFKPSRMQVSSYLREDRIADASEHTRLVPEDEDVAEGFDDFTEDIPLELSSSKFGRQTTNSSRNKNRINMSMTSNPSNERTAIRHLIDHAEGASPSDSDADSASSQDSDASAEHAYMTAQTRHGAGFSHLSKDERRRQEKEASRPKQPEKITPVPTLSEGLTRLRELKESADSNRQRAEMRKVEIERRLREVEVEKGRIQSALEELGVQLEETRKRVGEDGGGGNMERMAVERGVEGLGAH